MNSLKNPTGSGAELVYLGCPHPSTDELIELACRELDYLRRGAVEDHLSRCAGCRARFREIQREVEEVQAAVEQQQPPGRHSQPGNSHALALSASPCTAEELLRDATFAAFAKAFEELQYEGERRAFLADLMTPHRRLWFRACHALVHEDEESQCEEGLLEALDLLPVAQRGMARLHYRVAKEMRARKRSIEKASDELKRLADESGHPRGFVLDLAGELCTDPAHLEDLASRAKPAAVWNGNLRPAERKATVAGIVVERHRNPEQDQARLIFLTLEVLSSRRAEGRSLVLFPAPAFALWDRDDDFRLAEAAAQSSAELAVPDQHAVEVRWRIARYTGGELPPRICGPSLGLAFAFLLRHLLARRKEPVALVKLRGVAFTGALGDGELVPGGDTFLKWFVEGTHTIVAARESIDHPNIQPTDVPHIRSTPNGSAHILLASRIEEAMELLVVHLQSQGQGIRYDVPPPPVDFVGRQILTDRVLEFVDSAESGYGVLVGSMGSGKTTFFRHLVHLLAAMGRRPVCHFVPSQPGAASRGENLVKGLYYRLRRTYLTAEPAAWADWLIERRLEQLLNGLSERFRSTGEKVILVIDAADQSEVPARKRLLPDLLPGKLPPGVICLISSNPGLGWLREASVVTKFFGMGEEGRGIQPLTNDSIDVGRYLRQQDEVELPETLIREIESHAQPPVFFTVIRRLDELQQPGLSAERKNELLHQAELWRKPPTELIERKIDYILASVFPEGGGWDMVLRTLGLLALVREPVSEEQLRALGLWQEAVTDSIVREANTFFFRREEANRRQEPFQFAHQGYPKVIGELLGAEGKEACHRLLAESCLDWQRLKEPAKRYALRRAPAHLRRAGMWDELYELLTDFDYLEERMTPPRDNASEPQAEPVPCPNLPRQLVLRVMRDFELAAGADRGFPPDYEHRKAVEAIHRWFEKNMHVLQDSPHLLVQQLYNALAWDWDERTDLGRKLRRAMDRARRIVLRRLNRPAASSGRLRWRKFEGHRKTVHCVALSPDEQTVASASEDGTVILWRVSTGEMLRVLRSHDPMRSVTWSWDGKLLAGAGVRVHLWSFDTGECLAELEVAEGARAVAFSPEENHLLAVAAGDGSVRLLDAERCEWIRLLRPPGPAVLCMAFSHDGGLLAAGGKHAADEQGSVEIYDMRSRTLLRTLPPSAHWVHVVAFSPDGKLLATGGGVRKGEVRLFDVETGSFQRALDAHRSGVRALALARDGRLVTGSWDYTLALRDLATGSVLLAGMAHAEVVMSVVMSRCGNLIISASADHAVIVWHIDENCEPAGLKALALPVRKGHEGMIHASRFLPDGRRVATASGDGTSRIFAADGCLAGPVFFTNGAVANVAVVSPDGRKIAVGSRGIVKICDVATGATLHTLQGHQSYVLDIAWTPDSARLLTVSEDTTAMLWDARQGAWMHTLTGHTARLRAAAISPDGRHAATSGDDAKILVWDLENGQLIHTLHGHNLRVKALAYFSENLLASAGSDDFIGLWEPLSGREAGSIPIPSCMPETWALAFAPRRFLAAGGKDSVARIFDLETRELVACLPCQDVVEALSFSPDGAEFRVADRGGADLLPNVHLTQIVYPERR